MLRKGLELHIPGHLWTMHKQFCKRVALEIPERAKPKLPLWRIIQVIWGILVGTESF